MNDLQTLTFEFSPKNLEQIKIIFQTLLVSPPSNFLSTTTPKEPLNFHTSGHHMCVSFGASVNIYQTVNN